MKKTSMFATLFVVIGIVTFTSCEKKDHAHDEEELITTVKIVATELGSTNTSTFSFKDADGPGGLAPTIFDSIILNGNKSYSVNVQFLNESASPAEDITAEIREEAEDHQVYYEATGVDLRVSNLDPDSKGLPLGLSSSWFAGAVGKGSLKITLKHKPDAKAAGDPVTKGETDVEIVFPVRLK